MAKELINILSMNYRIGQILDLFFESIAQTEKLGLSEFRKKRIRFLKLIDRQKISFSKMLKFMQFWVDGFPSIGRLRKSWLHLEKLNQEKINTRLCQGTNFSDERQRARVFISYLELLISHRFPLRRVYKLVP